MTNKQIMDNNTVFSAAPPISNVDYSGIGEVGYVQLTTSDTAKGPYINVGVDLPTGGRVFTNISMMQNPNGTFIDSRVNELIIASESPYDRVQVGAFVGAKVFVRVGASDEVGYEGEEKITRLARYRGQR